MYAFIRILLFVCVVRPFVLLVLGIHVRGMANLPRKGPAIIVANHNSHLDTLVLLSLFPVRMINKLRPVGAKDYFLRNRFCKWFSLKVIRLIPLERKKICGQSHPFTACIQSLQRGEILFLFPEGSRGIPEELGNFKSGIAHLAKAMPEVPTIPIFIQGTGKALPRGEALFVPHICQLAIGESISWSGNRDQFMTQLHHYFCNQNSSPALPQTLPQS